MTPNAPAVDDGSELLTSGDAQDVLAAAVRHRGGTLVSWKLDHVDANPRRSTTATFHAVVDWPYGRREELIGASARVEGRNRTDERAVIFGDGSREVAVWIYPDDPDLVGLPRAAYPDRFAALLTELGTLGRPVSKDQVQLQVIGYRPRRRAVLKATIAGPVSTRGQSTRGPSQSRPEVLYVKVLRESSYAAVLGRHRLLLDAGLPSPPIAAATADQLLVLRELPGRPLARALFDSVPPVGAEDLIGLLDAMPAAVSTLERHRPWADAVDQYATMVAAALPEAESILTAMVSAIRSGLGGIPLGNEPTHGDFYEAQLFVRRGRVSGILDIDTIGPGRRADDLACLVAHLATVQRMNAEQASRVQRLIDQWLPVFDRRVDPVELRLRAAAIAISLATGPYRGQEADWQGETWQILRSADQLIRSIS
ncbi:phosphotransferase [Microlunatus elymi]|uniref:phosphotransferase n=1 Tax=Microlunatus elymi TaxID=2596828 RepID=UPI001D1943BD|nr:phosphotransferase [Microlunatus elymi]